MFLLGKQQMADSLPARQQKGCVEKCLLAKRSISVIMELLSEQEMRKGRICGRI